MEPILGGQRLGTSFYDLAGALERINRRRRRDLLESREDIDYGSRGARPEAQHELDQLILNYRGIENVPEERIEQFKQQYGFDPRTSARGRVPSETRQIGRAARGALSERYADAHKYFSQQSTDILNRARDQKWTAQRTQQALNDLFSSVQEEFATAEKIPEFTEDPATAQVLRELQGRLRNIDLTKMGFVSPSAIGQPRLPAQPGLAAGLEAEGIPRPGIGGQVTLGARPPISLGVPGSGGLGTGGPAPGPPGVGGPGAGGSPGPGDFASLTGGLTWEERIQLMHLLQKSRQPRTGGLSPLLPPPQPSVGIQ